MCVHIGNGKHISTTHYHYTKSIKKRISFHYSGGLIIAIHSVIPKDSFHGTLRLSLKGGKYGTTTSKKWRVIFSE